MRNYKDMTVGEIVSHNIEFAKVFQNHNIDFCCGGDVTLQDAAKRVSADIDKVLDELNEAPSMALSSALDFSAWSLDLLIDYIVKFHHNMIRTEGPEIFALLDKVVKAHGESDPHLFEVQKHFRDSLIDLHSHLDKEENILFPLVEQLLHSQESGEPLEEFHCGSVENPIRVMMMEHDNEGERFRTISKLTNNYTAPESACGSYRLVLEQLRQFEQNLHIHIHVENNILFRKAIVIEGNL